MIVAVPHEVLTLCSITHCDLLVYEKIGMRLDDEEAPTKRELKAIARGAQEYAKASQAMEPADENQGWTNDAPF